jgi:outer membrane autotransporter protein
VSAAQATQSLRSILGLRAFQPLVTAAGTRMERQGRLGWSHEYRDPTSVSARLAGDPTGTLFTVSGLTVPRDSAVLGIGIAGAARRDLRISADVDAAWNGAQHTASLRLGLHYRW